ncbi:hypothetical protein V6N13_039332 [Hibiscus sabdariffa]
MEDALRAQERLDGFPIYGHRVRVHLSRFYHGHSNERRKGPWTNQNIESKFRDLAKKLYDEGIRDISIMSLSGSTYLLIFKDHDRLVSFLKDHESVLKKWFRDVQEWSEEFSDCNRRVWISCQGIPIHAWSEETFGNIASLWGDLISIDERTTKPSSFYKTYFQILTNVPDRINNIVELKVASKIFKVRVCKFDPCFTPNSAWCLEEEESNFSTSDAAVENNKLNNAKEDVKCPQFSCRNLIGVILW